MRLAWGLAVLGQAAWAWRLWRAGPRDAWALYMAWGVVRYGVGLAFGQSPEWYAIWHWTEPVDIILRFSAVWQIASHTPRPSWVRTGLLVAGFFIVAFCLSPHPDWPFRLQLTLLISWLSRLLSGGIMLGALMGGIPFSWPTAYIFLGVLAAFGEMAVPRAWLNGVETLYLSLQAALFFVAVLQNNHGGLATK